MPKIPTSAKSKLSCYAFGQQLLETNDLDPIYVMLWEAKFPEEKLHSWLVAYFCFYHSGTASWIVDQDDYWEAMMAAAQSKEYPRCPERRHFRGQNAIKSVTYLQGRGVYDLFSELYTEIIMPAQEIIDSVKGWVGFGPWISFKVADMLERLDICKISFDVKTIQLFDSPAEGAELIWKDFRMTSGFSVNALPKEGLVPWAINRIKYRLGPVKAPPRYEREINVQECETILCKFKSYHNGHYKVGEDIESLKKSLRVFDSPTNLFLRKIVDKHLGEKSA